MQCAPKRPRLKAGKLWRHGDQIKVRFATEIALLLLAAPLAALLLARLSGRITWPRALLLAVALQVGITYAYLHITNPPLRIYGTGTDFMVDDLRIPRAPLAALLSGVAVLVTASMLGVRHLLARGKSGDSPPPA